jgi:hypothetical protein
MKKLDYFDLLSPDPVWLENVGYIRCPTLRDISKLKEKNEQYARYLNVLKIDIETYINNVADEETKELYESDNNSVTIYQKLIIDDCLRGMLHNAFSFFICGDVYFLEKDKTFYVTEKNEDDELVIIGFINDSNYLYVCDYILQMNCIKKDESEDQKYGSEKARRIAEKLKKFKILNAKKQSDKDVNLGNLISSLASRQNGLNIIDIWDMTVFQFYDQFHKQNYNNTIDIHSMNYAFMGGEFDLTAWFKDLRNDD